MTRFTKAARLGAILAGALYLFAASPAKADLILELERSSDTFADLTGSGDAPIAGGGGILYTYG